MLNLKRHLPVNVLHGDRIWVAVDGLHLLPHAVPRLGPVHGHVLRRCACLIERIAEEAAVRFAPKIGDNLTQIVHTSTRQWARNVTNASTRFASALAHLPTDGMAREPVHSAHDFETKHANLFVLRVRTQTT
jgi:hypothetical protein